MRSRYIFAWIADSRKSVETRLWSRASNSLGRWIFVQSIFYLVLGIYPVFGAFGLSGRDVMLQHEKARLFEDLQAEARLFTQNKDRKKREKTFTFYRKKAGKGEFGIRYNTLTRFHTPKEVTGEGILFLEQEDGKNEITLYLSKLKSLRRVETQNQSDSFMGSDLSYTDLATQKVDDFKYESSVTSKDCSQLINRSSAPPFSEAPISIAFDDHEKGKCYLVRMEALRDEVETRMNAKNLESVVSADTFMIYETRYYDSTQKVFKRVRSGQFASLPDKTYFPGKVYVENLKKSSFTLLEFSNVKGNSGIKASVFTKQNLSNP